MQARRGRRQFSEGFFRACLRLTRDLREARQCPRELCPTM